MKTISLSEHKSIMLDMLSVFADYCEKNSLNYFLDAGTLIGAVRHKGFIPWDDDVDLNMPQPDYDRFIELMRKSDNHINDYIIVEFPETTIYPYLKIVDTRTALVEFPDKYPMESGIYMDLFPKYGVVDKSWKSKFLCWTTDKLGVMHWVNKFTVNAWDQKTYPMYKKFIARTIRALTFDKNWAAKLMNKLMHRYALRHPYRECEYVTTLTNGEFHKLAPRKCFDGWQMLEFEGRLFRVPIDFDTYLHCLYKGDYMQLPPENQRYHHNIEIYWKQ